MNKLLISYSFFLAITVSGKIRSIQLPQMASERSSSSKSQSPPISISDKATSNTTDTVPGHDSLTGGFNTCLLAQFFVLNQTFNLQVDTGSSDTIIAHSSLNNFPAGYPVLNNFIPPATASSTDLYGDGSFWTGYFLNMFVSLPNENGTGPSEVGGEAQVAMMTQQSSNPTFVDGVNAQGLIGLAFRAFAHNGITLMDTWVENGVLPRNQVAIHGCPYASTDPSWIDWGAEDPYSACGGISVQIGMPASTYYTLDVKEIGVGRNIMPLSNRWQATGMLSVLDSCTSDILIPGVSYNFLIQAMETSGGMSASLLASPYLNGFYAGTAGLLLNEEDLIWSLLPTLNFTLGAYSDSFQNVSLILGPRQYIQTDTNGYYNFLVGVGDDNYSILGLPFFTSFHITLDRASSKITFQPGCGCESALDQFPIILANNDVPPCECTSDTETCSCSHFIPTPTQSIQVSSSTHPILSSEPTRISKSGAVKGDSGTPNFHLIIFLISVAVILV